MQTSRLYISLLLALMGLASCTSPHQVGVLFGPSRTVEASDYKVILDTWTRQAKIYQHFDSKAFITATFHSPEFRQVFPLAFPDLYGHGGNVTRRELVEHTEDAKQYLNFFVTLYTADSDWNDLAKHDSIWRLNLIGSEEVSVKSKEVLPVKIDANLRAVYPHIGGFDRTYIVRFPRKDPNGNPVIPESSQGFSFRIASALGHTLLTWELTPPPQ